MFMLSKILSFIYSKNIYNFIELDLKNLKQDYKNINNINFKKYEKVDYRSLVEVIKNIDSEERPFEINELEKRLHDEHMLFIAKKENNIIGFFWVSINKIEIPFFHATLYLNKDEAVDYNSYIDTKYRGKRINKGLKIFAFKYLKEIGYKKVFGYIKNNNISSIKANEYLGYRKIGEIKCIIFMTIGLRSHNLPTKRLIFHGGSLVLWKGLLKKLYKCE